MLRWPLGFLTLAITAAVAAGGAAQDRTEKPLVLNLKEPGPLARAQSVTTGACAGRELRLTLQVDVGDDPPNADLRYGGVTVDLMASRPLHELLTSHRLLRVVVRCDPSAGDVTMHMLVGMPSSQGTLGAARAVVSRRGSVLSFSPPRPLAPSEVDQLFGRS